MKDILTLNEVTKISIPEVGGKGANLGEMYQAKFPIPGAFIVTAGAYEKFITMTDIKKDIINIVGEIDVNNNKSLNEGSRELRHLFDQTAIPWEIESLIIDAYEGLKGKNPRVAVRSSATAEDLPEASFAGQQETYLHVKGKEDLLDKVKLCWSSLFTPRAIYYREQNGFAHVDVRLAVVVQRMVNSEVAGVMFTSSPIDGSPVVTIEAAYGLGESVVGGEVTPDTYTFDQKTKEITNKNISKQTWCYVKSKKGTEKADVDEIDQEDQKLTNEQIIALADIGMQIEKHYKQPMDVEWALEKNELYIVQARPVTTINKKKKDDKVKDAKGAKIITKGLAASPGYGTGVVKMIKDIEELDKVEDGDILVTKMTTPDMVPAMKKAAAIVTEEGGMTCHAAIVSRELGIPCIVGTGNATSVLNPGDTVTVNANIGVVYDGAVEVKTKRKADTATVGYVPITGTKILLNLGLPDKAEEYSELPVDGIGLLREEFIITSYVGTHPLELIKNGEEEKFTEALGEGIAEVARAFYPRPVVLRTSDFKTNEYRDLKGGEKYEMEEANPMIGWRGCSRYVSEQYEEAFRLELKTIKKLRDEMGLKNVWVMLPFVRTVDELKQIVMMMDEEGLKRGKDFKLWLMAEVPSNILLADQFAQYCDGFSIGSNDLTQLVMGADRDSKVLGEMGYFDERNEAVTRAIKMLVDTAHEHGKTVSICGQAPSVYPEFTEFLVRTGIDSISINADVALKTKRLVAHMEQKIILERMKKLSGE